MPFFCKFWATCLVGLEPPPEGGWAGAMPPQRPDEARHGWKVLVNDQNTDDDAADHAASNPCAIDWQQSVFPVAQGSRSYPHSTRCQRT